MRSEIMSRIRGKMTKMEIEFGQALWRAGVPFEYQPRITGRPDFRVGKLAVFLDSCFWHFCPEHGRVPKTNRVAWLRKFARNVERVEEVDFLLRCSGYTVCRIWEHQLRGKK